MYNSAVLCTSRRLVKNVLTLCINCAPVPTDFCPYLNTCFTQFVPSVFPAILQLPTTNFFLLTLRIQFFLDLRHLFADHKVEFDSFFDLFDRVDSGSMVFAAKLGRDTRETEVELATE